MGLSNNQDGIEDSLIKEEVFDILNQNPDFKKIKEAISSLIEKEEFNRVDGPLNDWKPEEVAEIESEMTYVLTDQNNPQNVLEISTEKN